MSQGTSRRDCFIKCIPTVLFAMIQTYLPEDSYRLLMNTNLAEFHGIKFETVHYTIVIDAVNAKFREYFFQFIAPCVKDKSKQLSFRIRGGTSQSLTECAVVFEECSNLAMDSFRDGYITLNNAALLSFQNVYRLHLHGVQGIVAFPANALSNTVILEVNCLRNLVNIDNLSTMTSLKRLSIDRCPQLQAFSPSAVQHIPHLRLTENNLLSDYSSLTQQETLFLRAENCYGSVAARFPTFSSIQKLELICHSVFLTDDVFHSIKDIPSIHLVEVKWLHGYEAHFCPAPLLNGKSIKLRGFDLSFWVGKEFPQMQVLDLENCQLSSLPIMPNLSELRLESIDDFQSMTFHYPKLTHVILKRLAAFDGKLNNLSHIRSLHLHSLENVKDISPVMNVDKLDVIHCEGANMYKIKKLSPPQTRDVYLSFALKLKDFSPFKNVYRLHLCKVKIRNCSDICNVRVLIIRDCHLFIDTSGLTDVKVLKIYDCSKLKMLINLKKIPVIEVKNCPKVEDYSGLGENQLVTLEETEQLETLYYEYQRNNLHSEIFGTIGKLERIRFGRCFNYTIETKENTPNLPTSFDF
jgi:hypothetical protein